MEFKDLLELFREYFIDYSKYFINTIAHPTKRSSYLALEVDKEEASIIAKSSTKRINQKLIFVMVISIFLGTTLLDLIPNRIKGPDQKTTIIAAVISWFIYASFFYLLCKLLKGLSGYIETVSVCLQVFSFAFVISSFAAILFTALIKNHYVENRLLLYSSKSLIVISNPIIFYLLIHTLIMVIYMPLSLGATNRFKLWKRLVLATVPVIFLFIDVSFYEAFGVIPMEAPPPMPGG